MVALITMQCKCCIMYADIWKIELFLCVLVYCTWLSIYVGVSTICVHNTMSFGYVSGVFVHMRVLALSETPPPPSAAALLS